jgi:hypothetical protein
LQQIRIEAELAAAGHYRAPAEVPLQDVQQLREGVTGPLALAFRPEVCQHLVATDAARTGTRKQGDQRQPSPLRCGSLHLLSILEQGQSP